MISDTTLRRIIKLLLSGEDHRAIPDKLIDESFLQESISFFKRVAEVKLNNKEVTLDWYKDEFLSEKYGKDNLAAYAGTSIKSINNKRGTTARNIVIEESNKHFTGFLESINQLCDTELEMELSIRFNNITAHLNLTESLVVVNALALRRQQIRGGAWSALGKRVEAPLLITLCKLFGVSSDNYNENLKRENREIDFALISSKSGRRPYKCEVKLMGKGNPESADGAYARNADVLIATTISKQHKDTLDNSNIHWIELGTERGFMKFPEVCERIGVPCNKDILNLSNSDIESRIDDAINQALPIH